MMRFSVEIETWGTAPDPAVLAALTEALAAQGAGGSVASAGGLAGGVGATFTVEIVGDPSSAVEAAVGTAVRAFERACAQAGVRHGGIARVDVMTDAYLDRWLCREPERFAGVREVAELLGVSRQRVSELRARPGFPAPVAELASGPVWKVSSLRRFLETWDRRPGRPRKVAAGSALDPDHASGSGGASARAAARKR
jgi:predicted DNA-binding transcriptional regulator AlpA